MGKKSRKNKGSEPKAAVPASAAAAAPAASAAPPTGPRSHAIDQILRAGACAPPQQPAVVYYPSDGPSDVELLQTKSVALQAKLDQLTQLGLANDRAGFVQQFVPIDLSDSDRMGYLQDLTTAPEAEGQWRNLIAEIAAIRSGMGVNRIEGDQIHQAIFYFRHPLFEQCDREVAFVCTNGEWRAEG